MSNTVPFDSDATRAAVTAAAQAVQAVAERQGYTLAYEQGEELAITVISHYQAFVAGVDYASNQHRSSADPGQ
jgi:hypothetical protein